MLSIIPKYLKQLRRLEIFGFAGITRHQPEDAHDSLESKSVLNFVEGLNQLPYLHTILISHSDLLPFQHQTRFRGLLNFQLNNIGGNTSDDQLQEEEKQELVHRFINNNPLLEKIDLNFRNYTIFP
eukprot:gb/GECH01000135.1/.p1 GENE.gb/GECH01000135.1/~~gb/GECH01000135.1/.p1  ORF type:complete len:126 (+),score=23.50 gb/GECH01000135.1/:1-378(+)